MLLALLMPVLGLEGGPEAAPKLGLASRGGFGPSGRPSVSEGIPGVEARDPGAPIGGGILELLIGALVGGRISPALIGGPRELVAPPLALLIPIGGPLGGGGVAAGLPVSSLAPPFLFTHLPRSGS
jgi:hypothetical protein